MLAFVLENPRSSAVKAVAALARRSSRAESGLFLLEGPQSLREALTFRPDVIVDLFVTPTAWERYPELSDLAAAGGIVHQFATESVIAAMADTVTPQGVVAVCRQFPTSIRDIFDGDVRLVAILHEVRDPGNAGTIIRAADAAGADAVIFAGRSVDLHNPKVVRSTTGSLFHLPIAVDSQLDDVTLRARETGLQVVAADISGDDLLARRRDGALSAPTAWLFGNEARGLSPDDLAFADAVVRVPLYGRAESMNLATAASVCLYESAFAQR